MQKYLNRISGPLLDRIDLQVEIFPVPFEELASAREGEKSEAIKRRVICAREIRGPQICRRAGHSQQRPDELTPAPHLCLN